MSQCKRGGRTWAARPGRPVLKPAKEKALEAGVAAGGHRRALATLAMDTTTLCRVAQHNTLNFKTNNRDFPGGPVVKTSPSIARGEGSIPGRGAKIPCASWPKNQNIKQKQYCKQLYSNKEVKKRRSNTVTNSIKTLKMVHIKKNL